MSDPPADTGRETPRRPSVSIPDTRVKQESLSPLNDDSAGTASHASVTSPSSDAPSPGSSPSATPSVKDLPEEGAPPAPEPRERRKRSRVSPEQLAVLEAIFAADRSPTAVRRKEISEQLGMNERQTQIWFQNRRAKAKQTDNGKILSKGKPSSSSPSSPLAPSPLHQIPRYPSQDLDLKKRIHEDDPVIVLPCTELSIGSWTRVSSAKKGKQHDLLAYVCEARRRLTWYVHYHEEDVEHSVKMDISFDSVADIKLSQATVDTAQASIYLSQPPVFYMEVRSSEAGRVWMPCGDWTAHQQATQVLRHDLSGACAPLTYLWKRLRSESHVAPPSLYSTHAPSPSIPIPHAVTPDLFAAPPQPAFSHGFLGGAARLQPMYDAFGSYPPAASFASSSNHSTGSLPHGAGSRSMLSDSPLDPLSPLIAQTGPAGGRASGSPPFAYAYPSSSPADALALAPGSGLALSATALARRSFVAHTPSHALFLGEPPPELNRLDGVGGVGGEGLVAPVPETPIDIGAFWMNGG